MGRNVGIILLGIAVFSLIAVGSDYYREYAFPKKPYDSIRNLAKDKSWFGPGTGERIELFGFRSENGASIPLLRPGQLVLLTLIDANCRMSATSEDLITEVRSHAKARGIEAYIVSYSHTEGTDNKDYFLTQKNLFGSDDLYIWNDHDGMRQMHLEGMVLPSNLLLAGDGTVLVKFPGSSKESETRAKMTQQIIQEIDAAASTYLNP